MARWFCGLLCNHTKAFWALYCGLACALSPPPHAMTLSSEEASAQPLPTSMHDNPLRRDTVNSARLSAVSVDMPTVRGLTHLIRGHVRCDAHQPLLIVVALPLYCGPAAEATSYAQFDVPCCGRIRRHCLGCSRYWRGDLHSNQQPRRASSCTRGVCFARVWRGRESVVAHTLVPGRNSPPSSQLVAPAPTRLCGRVK